MNPSKFRQKAKEWRDKNKEKVYLYIYRSSKKKLINLGILKK